MNLSESEKIVHGYLAEKGLPLDKAFTFPDVFIVDRKSRINRRSDITDLKVPLAKQIHLNIPVVSANMADVTESGMAIALARLGGCGFIHQFLPIEYRVIEVQKVKRADNEVIENPWLVSADDLLTKALDLMQEKQISGVLVTDNDGKLAGILTSRDIRFMSHRLKETQTTDGVKVKNIMTKMPLTVAKPGIASEAAIALMDEKRVEKLPLVDENGRPVGLMTAKDVLKKSQFPKAVRDKKGRLIVGAAVGIGENAIAEVKALLKAEVDVIVVDTARANSLRTAELVKEIRKNFPNLPLLAGNVDNPEGALTLIEAGVDGIKVGIGPGSACKTRTETGIGVPQLSAIAECAAIAKHFKISVIADGGIKEGSDLAKALVAGADSVMLGGLLAGTEETPGEVIYDSGEKFKFYRGSAGVDTQLARLAKGELDKVRAPEGVTRKVAYKGQKASEIIASLMENLRSAMSYADAMTIFEFQERKFRLQTTAGYWEGKPLK